MKSIEQRLEALEKATAPQMFNPSQVVVFDPTTGLPLVTPDPKAAKQIWIPDDGSGPQEFDR